MLEERGAQSGPLLTLDTTPGAGHSCCTSAHATALETIALEAKEKLCEKVVGKLSRVVMLRRCAADRSSC